MTTTSPSLRWVRVTPRLRVRFHQPPAFRLDRRLLSAHILGFREKNQISAAPELSLILLSRASVGGRNLVEALEFQKRHSRSQATGLLRRCCNTTIGGLRCGHVEILDTKGNFRDITYLRLFDACACVCGYRLPTRFRQRGALDAAARILIGSLEVDGEIDADALAPGKRVKVLDAGFSVVLPAGWVRQDLFGQVIVFAPGVGFRARICVSATDDDNLVGSADKGNLGAFDVLQLTQELSFSRSSFAKPLAIECAGRRGFCVEWTGTLARNGIHTQGRAVILPKKRGGILALYHSQAGWPFQQFEPVFDHVLRSIRGFRKTESTQRLS